MRNGGIHWFSSHSENNGMKNQKTSSWEWFICREKVVNYLTLLVQTGRHNAVFMILWPHTYWAGFTISCDRCQKDPLISAVHIGMINLKMLRALLHQQDLFDKFADGLHQVNSRASTTSLHSSAGKLQATAKYHSETSTKEFYTRKRYHLVNPSLMRIQDNLISFQLSGLW